MARVMVVDDSIAVRRIINKILVFAGHEVVCEAGDAETAIDLYKKHFPDVVTMDIKMKGVDGVTAARRIVALDPDARIVMISAVGDQDYVVESMRAGARYFLIKPIKVDRLVAAIAAVMGEVETSSDAA